MNKSREYINCSTGEVTQNYYEAISWYRLGNQVEIYENGKLIIAWRM